MTTTIYLHAPDEPTMTAALQAEGVLVERTDEQGNVTLGPAGGFQCTGYGGAILPTIWQTKPEYDAEGNVVTPGVPLPGFSANVLDIHNRLQSVTIDPDAETVTYASLVDWSAHGVTWIDPASIKTPAQTW